MRKCWGKWGGWGIVMFGTFGGSEMYAMFTYYRDF
jgi:hypothetical protein